MSTFEGRVVGDIAGRFIVPAYQRGYRWGSNEVRRLLDDILESEGSTYYLQPIVVKSDSDGAWELIDGQQRLTTLYLIIQFIRQTAVPIAMNRYELEYATRARSAEFLQNPDARRAGENIDFFHIHQAWECIRAWFEAHGPQQGLVAINLFKALSERVKVIWYEAADVDETELFRRLNVGKIPLTDAELVKALVLSRIRDAPGVTDRSHAVAAEWDAIERDLRVPEVWAFLTGRAAPQATHISLILETLAGAKPGGERDPFHTFETLRAEITADAEAFWDRVIDLHSLVLGWYEDRNLFHKVGYLVATRVPFGEILRLAGDATKREFEAALDARIRSRLGMTRERLTELSYDRPQDGARLAQALLLMNVETVRRAVHSSERYSFRAHASGAWSLEHIHAQNAEGLRTVEQWTDWLRLHRDALENLPELDTDARLELEERITAALPGITEDIFHTLERELLGLFAPSGSGTAEGDEHTIANLALLDSRDNSALSNSAFEVKRLAVLARDRAGSYIPVCTRNVFLKYYTDERVQQLHYWGMHDREAYLAAIERELSPYLAPDDDEEPTP